MSGEPFHPYGTSHLTVLGLSTVVLATMCFWARRGPDFCRRWSERILALVLLAEWPCNMILSHWAGEWSREVALPAHLCDVAALAGGCALLTRRPIFCELLYFWGLAGTMQGLLTPALAWDFPHPRFFGFFALHCGVVVAALYIVLGARVTPRRGAVARAFGWLMVYATVAGVIDAITGADYGFLRAKPAQGSLLDFMGPWPWYIAGLTVLALVSFVLLDLPWRRRRSATP